MTTKRDKKAATPTLTNVDTMTPMEHVRAVMSLGKDATLESAINAHPCAVENPTTKEAVAWIHGQLDHGADYLQSSDAHEEAAYREFLTGKSHSVEACGFTVDRSAIHPLLGDWRTEITRWGIRRGRAAFFEACGCGKTIQQLEWARIIWQRINKPILLMCPLAVAEQTLEESRMWTGKLPRKFKKEMSYPVRVVRTQSQIAEGINIANYDILEHFDPAFEWGGMVIDESSILKAMDGSTRDALIAFAKKIPYRLCCSATPSPNDHMELGNQAEFLGIMTYAEMLAVFFTHDGGDTSKWRLKGHAEQKFWEWLATWCIAIRRPGDIGYSDQGFDLPELVYHHHVVESPVPAGMLFAPTAGDIQERRQARRDSLDLRVAKAKEIIDAEPNEQWLMWCNLNDESSALKQATGGCEVVGSDKPEYKASSLLGFAHGKIKDLISKVTIAGFGMNFQSCAREIIYPTDSWEQFHQGIRRCWRFGQKRTVHAHLIYSESEKAVIDNLERKEQQYNEMMEQMVAHMKTAMIKEIRGSETEVMEYDANQDMIIPDWLIANGMV